VLANTFGLGIQQEAELKNAVRAVYKENGINHKGILEFDSEIIFPSFNEVGYYLENGEKELEKLYNRLDPLFDLNLFAEKYRNIGFSNIIESSNIIKLSDIQDDKIKNAIAKMIIVSAHGYYLGIPHTYSLRKIFVFDEAHRVLDTDFVEKFIRECRSFGVGVLLSSQQTDDFPENVLGQLATKIIHGNDGDSRLTKKIKSLISYDGDDNSINNLQTFNAIVSSQDYNNWFIDTLAWPQLIILKIISDSPNGISLEEIIDNAKKMGISKGWSEFIKLLLEKDYIDHINSSYIIKK
jgi:DNA phosphorothioation-dependent restriction protein DptH